MGSDTSTCTSLTTTSSFNPRPPSGERQTESGLRQFLRRFKQRPPSGGRPVRREPCGRSRSGFNPRPEWGATCRHACHWRSCGCFNPRPRVGSDPGAWLISWANRGFNHAPRVGSDRAAPKVTSRAAFQSTPPSGERHPQNFLNRNLGAVSIHAPEWGATKCRADPPAVLMFQSTPTEWGATSPGSCIPGIWLLFQSHAPRVGATTTSRVWREDFLVFQSTPPEWGATQSLSVTGGQSLFHSTPRVGSDIPLPSPCQLAFQFQYTPPSGERLLAISCLIALELLFQSTPPSGERLEQLKPPGYQKKFQSTPPEWGASETIILPGMLEDWFQSTPPVWVSGRFALETFRFRRVSIHAPEWGATATLCHRSEAVTGFHSTPPSGERTYTKLEPGHTTEFFNPRPRVGSDFYFASVLLYAMFQSTTPEWGADLC